MFLGIRAHEAHCKYRIGSNAETIFYFIDAGGKTADPKATGFFASKVRYDTPRFGTQAFAEFISSAWSTQVDERPALLRLHITKRSAAADYNEGDRIWCINVHKMRHGNIQMWKAYTLAMYHTPTLDIQHLNHTEMILLNRIPANAVGEDITHAVMVKELPGNRAEEAIEID
ncbi:hypothetical protein NHQ30_001298 [Ciborinia camelliae]|nr:hypothetical protein NHQ30_001298 [Ciborinia camelliae]